MGMLLGDLLDLVFPLHCAGCATQATGWCACCAAAFDRAPAPVRPRVDPRVPCWTLGSYDGVRRAAVLAAKERRRRDLAAPFGTALANGLARLCAAGAIGSGPMLLVPAPTRRSAARSRGGDPVTRFVRAAAGQLPDCLALPMLELTGAARDSVGLSAAQRRRNLAGRVRLARPGRIGAAAGAASVVVIDDVLTTGATISESVRVLAGAGIEVAAALTLTAA